MLAQMHLYKYYSDMKHKINNITNINKLVEKLIYTSYNAIIL